MSLCSALHSIITKKNFCFLCYRSVDENTLVSLADEINVELMKYAKNITLMQILQCVIGTELLKEIADFTSRFAMLCVVCTKTVVNSYIFIQNSIDRVKNLNTAINELANIIEYTDKKDNCKSLYLSLNLNDFTSKIYYDSNEPASSAKEALRQFKTLDNLKIKKIQDQHNGLMKKTDNCKSSVRLVDMLWKGEDNKLKCKVCTKPHANLRALRYHFTKAHSNRPYKCGQCTGAYCSQELLEEHIHNKHTEVICSQCGKSFNNRNILMQHELDRHYRIVCTDCGRTYKNSTTYKKHKIHHVCEQKVRASHCNAKYTCDYCNKKYTQKISLRVHIQYEHGNYKAHVCKWCGKKFWAQSRLNDHIVKHTKERKFTCDICGGNFVTKYSLLYHTRRHTGERPHECPYCDAKFLSSSRKADHIKRAHKSSEYECNVCHNKFGSLYYLQKHMKMHSDSQVNEASSLLTFNINNRRTVLSL